MQMAREFLQAVEEKVSKNPEPWVGAELDLEVMYVNILKIHINMFAR